jgi:hypothetical protein
MLLGGVFEVRRGAHELQRLVVLALGARGPCRGRLLLDVDLLGPVRLLGGDQRRAVALKLLDLGARAGGVTGARGADGSCERRDSLRPREAIPGERLGSRAERRGLAPAVLLERDPRGNCGIGVGGHEALWLRLLHCGQLLEDRPRLLVLSGL